MRKTVIEVENLFVINKFLEKGWSIVSASHDDVIVIDDRGYTRNDGKTWVVLMTKETSEEEHEEVKEV